MLSDKDLIHLVSSGAIIGTKLPHDPFSSDSPVQSASVDLHIGGIHLPGAAAGDAGGENHPLKEYLLQTGDTVLIRTAEELKLPKNIGGFAFPPSSFAVKALLITNPGHVDPEYAGPLRFTIINMGHEPQKLETNNRVGTLVLFRTYDQPQKGWTTRHGKPGRNPNTEDLRYLSRDFVEVTERTTKIAKKAMEAWDKRLAIIAFLITLFVTAAITVFGWYSPVGKLENKVDELRDEFTHANRVDKIDEQLKSLESSSAQREANLESRVEKLQKEILSLESKR